MQRLRSEAGVTLPELLVAMLIGLATVFAVYAVLDTTIKQTSRIAGRVNATQRGRIAMDSITRQLRSQVCYSPTVPALVSGSDDAVKFHLDMSDGTKSIEQREIAFDATSKTITERVWPGVGTPLTFPTRTINRQLVGDVVRRVAPDTTQIFRYYAFSTATTPKPDVLLPTPLSATDLARVARIEVGFMALPPGGNANTPGTSTLQNEIYVRVADPNDPAPTPTCA